MVYLPMEVQASTMKIDTHTMICTQPAIGNPQETCDMPAYFVNKKDSSILACKYHIIHLYIEHKYGKDK